MVSSRSVNQPLGRYHVLVFVGEGGILKKVAKPMTKVIKPLFMYDAHQGCRNTYGSIESSALDEEKPSDMRLPVSQ